ncbi:hypothetical protein AYI68_g6753, partial [Smittium mucronatum]
MRTYGKRVQST